MNHMRVKADLVARQALYWGLVMVDLTHDVKKYVDMDHTPATSKKSLKKAFGRIYDNMYDTIRRLNHPYLFEKISLKGKVYRDWAPFLQDKKFNQALLNNIYFNIFEVEKNEDEEPQKYMDIFHSVVTNPLLSGLHHELDDLGAEHFISAGYVSYGLWAKEINSLENIAYAYGQMKNKDFDYTFLPYINNTDEIMSETDTIISQDDKNYIDKPYFREDMNRMEYTILGLMIILDQIRITYLSF